MRDQLRSATHDLHQTTDDLIGTHADVGSVNGYPIFLAVMHDVISRFGADCDRVSVAINLPERAQSLQACLARDLNALDVPAADTAPAEGTRHERSLYWSYGCAYALEGSALGAAVLRKAVHVEQHHATSYLDLLVGDRRARWPAFTTCLDSLSIGSQSIDEMIHGASAVFERVQGVTRQFGGVQ